MLLTASVERNFEKQLVLFVLGMCQGELVYSCVFQKFAGVMAVGGFHCVSAWSAWI
ncbi:YphA family membrane protein [Bacillus subtilis]|uniref:YphA family membrane protein n=1 Tax=Bacillus subtilis TaxID=1423 RepID=UPI000AB9AE1D